VCGRKWEFPNTSTITLLIAEYKTPSKQSPPETEVVDDNEIESEEVSSQDEYDKEVIPIDIVKMISNHILSIVNTLEIEEIDPQTNQITKRFCTYKDIAIISAERSKYKNLKKEFSDKNIPSSFDSESNFFELPEIEDIFSFLEFYALRFLVFPQEI
jgi:ATP-dependent exoDNAse (exonuclease V) beta subunit